MSKQKLRRALMTEELFVLTGDALASIVLHQFLYWSMHNRDKTDRFIAEEKKRDPDLDMDLTEGWIYKTAEEMGQEVMTDKSVSTVARRINELVEKGWLARRRNPKHKWDRTYQYRPDYHKIESDLREIGYTLATVLKEYYPMVFDAPPPPQEEPICHHDKSIRHHDETVPEITFIDLDSPCESSASPSGEALSKAESAPKRKRKVTEWERKRWELAECFTVNTGIAVPKQGQGVYKHRESMWWQPLRTVYDTADEDVARAKDMIAKAVAYNRAEKLSIVSPASIEKIVISQAAEVPQKGAGMTAW